MAQRRRNWLVLTNVDPFPVFRSHVNWNHDNPGPFYAAGGKTYHFDDARTRTWAEQVVAHWAPLGYRFTLTEEVK
jgi:hypothetical protein